MIISFKGNTGGGGYVLPTATDTRLGGVKVGSGLTIDSGGTLSADGDGAKETILVLNSTGDTQQAELYSELKTALANATFDASKYKFMTNFKFIDGRTFLNEILLVGAEQINDPSSGRISFAAVYGTSSKKGRKQTWRLETNGSFNEYGTGSFDINPPSYADADVLRVHIDSGTSVETLENLGSLNMGDYCHAINGLWNNKSDDKRPLPAIVSVVYPKSPNDKPDAFGFSSFEWMKVYRTQAQWAEVYSNPSYDAYQQIGTIEGKFYNPISEKWRKVTIARSRSGNTYNWDAPVFSDVDSINIDDIPNNELWYRSDNGQIKNLYLDDWTTHPEIVSNGYYTKKDLGKIVFATPLTELGAAACYAIGIKGVIIPDYITQLGVSCFAINPLTAITLPDTITNIPFDCFSQCRQLTEVHLGSGTTQLEETAFAYCESLSSLTIPASVTTFGDNLFLDCTALSDIYYQSTMSDWGNISKGTDWNSGCPTITVHCTDGDITI